MRSGLKPGTVRTPGLSTAHCTIWLSMPVERQSRAERPGFEHTLSVTTRFVDAVMSIVAEGACTNIRSPPGHSRRAVNRTASG